MKRAVSIPVLLILLLAGLTQAGLLLGADADTQQDEGDRYDAEPEEWEKQVAADARGDVLLDWPGSMDLLYMTIGNLYSLSRGEAFVFLRIGYNVTLPGDETVTIPDESPSSLVPDPPSVVDDAPILLIRVAFNVTSGDETRTEHITLVTESFGGFWATDQGLLVADNSRPESSDNEVLYAAPLRRFGLQEGDVLDAYNVTSQRNGRDVDTMHAFDPADDYLPAYPRLHPLLDDPQSAFTPLLPEEAPPVPDPGEPPEPVPPLPKASDFVPDRPYDAPPDTGPQGVPEGTPDPDDLEDWDPDHDGPLPWDAEDVVDGVTGEDSGTAWNASFTIEEGTSRFVVRSHQRVLRAGIDEPGYGNFTVENTMEEIDQRVGLFWSGPPGMRWLMRYGLDMPLGIKPLPADGKTQMSIIAMPDSLFARPVWAGTAIFVSDWGGIEVVPLILQSTTDRMENPIDRPDSGLILPENPRITILNPDSTFRVNERRTLLVQVRDEETGLYVSQLRGVRAFIYPEGAAPGKLPYQLREKPWMDGVYEVPFVFDRPGAWHVNVYLFDYPPESGEGWPHDSFTMRIEYNTGSPELMPLSLALLCLGLVVSAVWAREQITKKR